MTTILKITSPELHFCRSAEVVIAVSLSPARPRKGKNMNESPNPETSPPRIYLDYAATTPVDPQVLEAMLPYFGQHFGNPSSANHAWGWTASSAVEKARGQIAKLINAQPSEIFFNSGASEGNNNVLFGLLRTLRAADAKQPVHYLLGATEHSSVRNGGLELRKFGVDVEFVPVNSDGVVSVTEVEKRIRPTTRLISMMWINNEIGAVHPIDELANLAKVRQIYFHTDAVQMVGKAPVDVQKTPVDLLTLSAHKFYGPKGAGALYIRSRNPAVTIDPLLYGGGQEDGQRSGTSNVPGIVGLGAAAELCGRTLSEDLAQRRALWLRLREGIRAEIPSVRFNTPEANFATALSVTFPGRPVDLALTKLQRLGFSTGSACSTGGAWISPVLKAIGLSDDDAGCTIRLSLGRKTTLAEIEQTIAILKSAFLS